MASCVVFCLNMLQLTHPCRIYAVLCAGAGEGKLRLSWSSCCECDGPACRVLATGPSYSEIHYAFKVGYFRSHFLGAKTGRWIRVDCYTLVPACRVD